MTWAKEQVRRSAEWRRKQRELRERRFTRALRLMPGALEFIAAVGRFSGMQSAIYQWQIERYPADRMPEGVTVRMKQVRGGKLCSVNRSVSRWALESNPLISAQCLVEDMVRDMQEAFGPPSGEVVWTPKGPRALEDVRAC